MAEESFESAEAIGCVVFDFDATLASKHVWRALYDPSARPRPEEMKGWDAPSVSVLAGKQYGRGRQLQEAHAFAVWAFGGPERLAAIQTFLQSLYANGVQLYIASKGILEDILATLGAAGIDPHWFRYIYAFPPESYRISPQYDSIIWNSVTETTTPFRGGKIDFMIWLMQQGECAGGPMLYIDDDAVDYPAAQRLGILTIGTGPLLTAPFRKESGGITPEQMAGIQRILVLASQLCANCGEPTESWDTELCRACVKFLPLSTRQQLDPKRAASAYWRSTESPLSAVPQYEEWFLSAPSQLQVGQGAQLAQVAQLGPIEAPSPLLVAPSLPRVPSLPPTVPTAATLTVRAPSSQAKPPVILHYKDQFGVVHALPETAQILTGYSSVGQAGGDLAAGIVPSLSSSGPAYPKLLLVWSDRFQTFFALERPGPERGAGGITQFYTLGPVVENRDTVQNTAGTYSGIYASIDAIRKMEAAAAAKERALAR